MNYQYTRRECGFLRDAAFQHTCIPSGLQAMASLAKPKCYVNCSLTERMIVREMYGGDLPDEAVVHLEGGTLVIESLDLNQVAQMNAGRLPDIQITLE